MIALNPWEYPATLGAHDVELHGIGYCVDDDGIEAVGIVDRDEAREWYEEWAFYMTRSSRPELCALQKRAWDIIDDPATPFDGSVILAVIDEDSVNEKWREAADEAKANRGYTG